jgi:D-sedoheptulose 7-phosphate isomerase
MMDVTWEIQQAIDTKRDSLSLGPVIAAAGAQIVRALQRGNKVLVCGNGGSAADAQHLATELVGRFELSRRGLPCLALTADTCLLTALANDHGYQAVFARQVAAHGVPGDVLVAISTSGKSESVINALTQAEALGIERIALVGCGGGRMGGLPGVTVVCAPSDRTCRIQEVHTMVVHIWAQMVDEAFADGA